MTSLLLGCTLSAGLSGDLLSIRLSVPLSGDFTSLGALTAGAEGAGWLVPLFEGLACPFSCGLTDGDASGADFSGPRTVGVVSFGVLTEGSEGTD